VSSYKVPFRSAASRPWSDGTLFPNVGVAGHAAAAGYVNSAGCIVLTGDVGPAGHAGSAGPIASAGDGVSAGKVGTAGQVGSAVPVGTAGFDRGYDTARLMPPASLGDYEQLRQQPGYVPYVPQAVGFPRAPSWSYSVPPWDFTTRGVSGSVY